MASKFYQQGDILLVGITKIPKTAKKVRSKVLAEGEATGHSHAVVEDDVQIFEKNGTLYMRAPKGATVKHQEHKPVKVPKGDYRVNKVREYDHVTRLEREVVD